MRVILFGAGASVDQGEGSSPALMGSLLSELEAFAPNTWGAIPEDTRELINQHFERGLEHLLANAWPDYRNKFTGVEIRFPDPYTPQELLPYELIWDMAEYFIRFIPKKDSLYLRLLLKLYESGSAFALSTLNYDCLLIRVVNYLDHYFPSCQYTTCFPHGNAAFFCEGLLSPSGVATANAKSPIEYHINSNGHLVSNGKLGIIESLSHLRKLRVDYLLSPPVLCHINPAKFAMSGANIIDEQQLNFRKLISRAEKIAIIGTSVNENDEHIWSPLAQTNAQILYVSGSSSVDGFLEWAAKHQRAQDKVRRAYWSEAETDVYKFLEV